ncbi:MAG: cobyric acid synthase, partial [Chitinivibrionales bacterium]|nr:cobyric acid synthase [Chitinivibrionales bacterium]
LQAQACRIAPHVFMNPILLKPTSDRGCQVIVCGKSVDTMSTDRYGSYKEKAWKTVTGCYDELSRNHDIIVLEGAGSPAEVNLKRKDIVNMAMAAYARAPVLLTGDIDRGGLFASFIGTMETFQQWERDCVAGFIINRFRGDASLLTAGCDYLQEYTGKKTLGIIPYIPDLNLPEEDSVSFKESDYRGASKPSTAITVGLIDLPHISNFTDFDPLAGEPDVRLVKLRKAPQHAPLDAIIIPGSKNVVSDMHWLEMNGIGDWIRNLAGHGNTEIIGLCGGYQMLGTTITDPNGIESDAQMTAGFGLLPITTTFESDKVVARTEAIHTISHLSVHGYEIHHGRTTTCSENCIVLFVTTDGTPIGVGTTDHRIWGTYLHGVFDDDTFRRWMIDRWRRKRMLPAMGQVVAPYDVEPALNRLAAIVRSSIDMSTLYRLLGV